MTDKEQQLNAFLVGIFGDILRLEERSLSHGEHKNLSVTEMHLLDAVALSPADQPLTMAVLAGRVRVSAGSLTVAVKALEQKGYLLRTKSETDRRQVLVTLTQKAHSACAAHEQFHREMVGEVARRLSQPQLDALAAGLKALDEYFTSL